MTRVFVGVMGVMLSACSARSPHDGGSGGGGGNAGTGGASGSGHIVYTRGASVFRMSAAAGAQPIDVSQAITGAAHKSERRLNTSRNGQFLIFETQNIDPACDGDECLAVAPSAAPEQAVLVTQAGMLLKNVGGRTAITDDGNTIAWVANTGNHALDVFVATRIGTNWGAAVNVTSTSSLAWNDVPAFTADGTRLLFDCGPEAYAGTGNSICEVATVGGSVKLLVSQSDAPTSVSSKGPCHHGSYATDGAIVFEADWGGERVWRRLGAAEPTQVATPSNDNSPCALPDGRIASLWLGHSGNPMGFHELKVMNADGSNPVMLVTGVDIDDIGLGCSD